jgi:ParB family transcriptional regulator, chromosome partitioning protein
MNAINTFTGLGLDSLGDISSLLNQPEINANNTGPLNLNLDLIDEDPNQPRTKSNPGFSAESLEDLAKTIRQRGVKTPISVRVNPEIDGRYLVNHGARRLRATQLAGQSTIPAFIDNDYNQADQVIENLQRNELTPREIADFIGREIAKGKMKRDIAQEIGKSNAFVSQHVALLDLPDPIAKVFNTGRSRDVTLINELVTVNKKKPDEVAAWLADENQEITRGSVKLLREFLESKGGLSDEKRGVENADVSTNQNDVAKKDEKSVKEMDSNQLKKMMSVWVEHLGRSAQLILNRRPSSDGLAWLKYKDNNLDLEVDLSEIGIITLLEN